MLRSDDEFLAAGREFGRLDEEVLEVDCLYFGILLGVDLEDRGGDIEAGHQPHRGLGMELCAADDDTLLVALEVHVLVFSVLDSDLCRRFSFFILSDRSIFSRKNSLLESLRQEI